MKKVIGINFLIFTAMVLGAEAICWLLLKSDNQEKPFLFDRSSGIFEVVPQSVHDGLTFLDPLLGWARDPVSVHPKVQFKNDYAVWGTPEDQESFRILITGGSTSDATGKGGGWPGILARKMNEAGYCVTVYAGAVPGYNSSQEMLKTLRDAPNLKPHLHISYSGTNELTDLDWNYLHTQFHQKLTQALVSYKQSFFLPNTIWYLLNLWPTSKVGITGLSKGREQVSDRGIRWSTNMRRMRALAREFNYNFIGVLQPTLGYGEYTLSENEKQIFARKKLNELWPEFYKIAWAETKKYDFLVDFTDVYAGKTDLFLDDCHVNKSGHNILADKMMKMIKAKHSQQLEALKSCQQR